MPTPQPPTDALRLVLGFVAAFLATILFHQVALAILWVMGIAPFAPLPVRPVPPFGVPAVVSLAFWGGVWGIGFALLDRRFPRGWGYPVVAFIFGAVLPTLVAIVVVVPLKGGMAGGGFNPMLLLTALLINGVWGVGTGMLLRGLEQHFRSP